MIEAIVFDFDGLLANSQPLQYEANRQVFESKGVELTREHWREWVAGSYTNELWIKEKKLGLNIKDVRREKNEIYKLLVREQLELMPGAKEVVRSLSADFVLMIASHSYKADISFVLRKNEIDQYFSGIVTLEDVDRGKPAPDIYASAAKYLDLAPAQCLAVEDSESGLQSAKASGMLCVIVPDQYVVQGAEGYLEATTVLSELCCLNKELIDSLVATSS